MFKNSSYVMYFYWWKNVYLREKVAVSAYAWKTNYAVSKQGSKHFKTLFLMLSGIVSSVSEADQFLLVIPHNIPHNFLTL